MEAQGALRLVAVMVATEGVKATWRCADDPSLSYGLLAQAGLHEAFSLAIGFRR